MKLITIQPKSSTDNLETPYPFHIAEDGDVVDQDFWRGDPKRVIGFQNDADVQRVDLLWADAVKDPESIVGRFPVMVTGKGGMYTYTIAIESVTVREVPA